MSPEIDRPIVDRFFYDKVCEYSSTALIRGNMFSGYKIDDSRTLGSHRFIAVISLAEIVHRSLLSRAKGLKIIRGF